MTTKLERARQILQYDGPRELLKESGLYLLRNTSLGDDLILNRSKAQVAHRMANEDGLEDILETVLDVKPGIRPYQVAAVQLRSELREITRLIEDEKPRTALEIGTANGGTLYTWCRYVDSITDIISVDLPGGQFGGGYSASKTSLYREFTDNKDLHFVRGNSHDTQTFEEVRDEILEQRLPADSIDFMFIDGDHTYDGVRQDFEMYRRVMSDEGVIAFHDIVKTKDNVAEVERIRQKYPSVDDEYLPWSPNHPDMEVDEFWADIKEDYRTREIIARPEQTAYGIGVLWL